MVELNRVVVVAKVHGPEAVLAALRPLEGNRSLRNYYLLPAVQGQLLLDIGDKPRASDVFVRRSSAQAPSPNEDSYSAS